jgi:hypothetical protein
MGRAYNVIDADGHILEPLDLWDKYIDPAFRDHAPRVVKGQNGKERLVIKEHAVGDSGSASAGSAGSGRGRASSRPTRWRTGRQARRVRPHKHSPTWMPTASTPSSCIDLGLFSGGIHDPLLAAATCRAYNRWLADCKPYPDRLFGVACCRCSRSTSRSPRCGSPVN